MRIDVLTIFPELITPHLSGSLLGRAVGAGVVDVVVTDVRDFGRGRHRQVDDTVFGGGPGMVLRADVVADAVESLAAGAHGPGRRIVLMPAGRPLTQALLRELAGEAHLVLLCGRYEGVDERALEECGFEAVSIGDYVIAGGELAALVVVEGVTRLLPGVMGNAESAAEESFEGGLLEAPAYTRPASWRGRDVPPVLLGGNHGAIAAWRRSAAVARTRERRPEVLDRALAGGLGDPAEGGGGAAAPRPGPRGPAPRGGPVAGGVVDPSEVAGLEEA